MLLAHRPLPCPAPYSLPVSCMVFRAKIHSRARAEVLGGARVLGAEARAAAHERVRLYGEALRACGAARRAGPPVLTAPCSRGASSSTEPARPDVRGPAWRKALRNNTDAVKTISPYVAGRAAGVRVMGVGAARAGGAALPRVEGEALQGLERARLARVALAHERQLHLPTRVLGGGGGVEGR